MEDKGIRKRRKEKGRKRIRREKRGEGTKGWNEGKNRKWRRARERGGSERDRGG